MKAIRNPKNSVPALLAMTILGGGLAMADPARWHDGQHEIPPGAGPGKGALVCSEGFRPGGTGGGVPPARFAPEGTDWYTCVSRPPRCADGRPARAAYVAGSKRFEYRCRLPQPRPGAGRFGPEGSRPDAGGVGRFGPEGSRPGSGGVGRFAPGGPRP